MNNLLKILSLALVGAILLFFAPPALSQTCDDHDRDGDGYACTVGDCDDSDPNVYPGAPERCNGRDDDCNQIVDDAPDDDGDGLNECQGDCDDHDATVRPGRTEVCDGKDNDCDASTADRDLRRSCYTGPSGTSGVGLCRGGQEACTGTAWSGVCGGQVVPSAEQCDDTDHDCDGNNYNGIADADRDGAYVCHDCDDNDPLRYPGNNEICDGRDNDCDPSTRDQDISRSCYTGPSGTRNVGVCRGGTESCGASGWSGVCSGQVTPSPEQCDDTDHDCDGNDYNGQPDGDGDGAVVCVDCDDSDPLRYPGNTEVCDGRDNDCNPATRDTDLQRSCFPSPTGRPNVGICRPGQESCTGNTWGACVGAVLPRAEQCDDTDHDCDGNDYNGFANADGDPVPACRGDCDDNNPAVYPGAPEICDNLDNDCNGSADENFDNDGDGYTTCDLPRADCNDNDASIYPGAPEVCDGVDQDCDGTRDNGFADNDNDGVVVCLDCNDNDPDMRPGRNESCDGKDNDCDGRTDERDNQGRPLRRSCYTGPSGTNGVGTCRSGRWECTNGAWPTQASACSGQVVPQTETCDQRDDDCDGDTDEDFDGDGDGFVSCGPNVDCDDTDAERHPGRNEACDGKDNDCDGDTDERPNGSPLTADCYTGTAGTENVGECRGGYQRCLGAAGYGGMCVDEVTPAATDACDGKDNDCDGDIDEGFDVDQDGVTECGGDCNDNDPDVRPGALEVCNAVDDDCDGTIDGNDTACYTGPAATATVGECHPGTAVCTDGAPGTCHDEQTPAPEICDGKDNDCDGEIDEDFDADQDGVVSCNGDCDDDNPFVASGLPERCDCFDNNCDGEIDEDGFGGTVCEQGACHDFDADGYTNCDGDCDDRSPNSYPGAPELCGDNIDNDCDGVVDEDVDEDRDGVTTCEGDCDDRFSAIHPYAAEVCDGFDNDCDGERDEGFDEDGDFVTVCAGDCDDSDPRRSPLKREICGNGIDDDCDHLVDPDDDADTDGHTVCGGDCNDFNAAVYPGAEEVCDGHDNDCDRMTDEGFDVDNDTFAVCFGDCADNDPAVHPFAREVVDGIDNNCNGQIDEGQDDADGDGFSFLCGDCNDQNASVSPQTVDRCDGVDNNCDGRIDRDPWGRTTCATCNDVDNDGVSDCDGDCADDNPSIHPGITEVCNGIDDDCDGTIDRHRFTGAHLCVVTDAGTSTTPDAATNDLGTGPSFDGGMAETDGATDPVPGALAPPGVVDYGCGCSTSEAPAKNRHAPILLLVALVAGLVVRQRSRRLVVRGILFVAAATGVGCTEFILEPAPASGSDASAPPPRLDAEPNPIDAGFTDAGTPDAEDVVDYLEGPCRIVGPGQVSLHSIPSRTCQVAAHPGTEVMPLDSIDALVLTDDPRGLYAFVVRLPLDADLDPDDPLAASQWLDRYVDPLFSRSLPGVVGSADRVDERLKQAFLRQGRPAARTLRTVTMINDVAPSQVRVGALSALTGVPLASLQAVPRPLQLSPTRVLNLIAYAETEAPDGHVRAIVALAGDAATASAATRLSDLATGSHLGPAGLPVRVECEVATAEALKVDFVWVVDNSASMLEEQEALSATADQFFEALVRSRIDFRLGVVSTDGEALRGGGFTRDVDEFRQRVRVGVNGNGREAGLEFAVRAVERAQTSSSAIARLRDDAVTVVVFFSDEDSTNLSTPIEYAETLERHDVLAFAVVGPRPRGCSAIGRGIARRGESYIQVAERLGGSSASICALDLSAPINEILVAAGGAASRTALDAPPIAGSIEVALPTRLVERSRLDGFDYEPTANTVLFFGDAALAVGTRFRISYSTFVDSTR